MGFKPGKSWPDEDVIDTLPRIVNNLSKVASPTGFESWMIVRRDTHEIIGDAGFKGFSYVEKSIDLGYGIIKEERRKGFAEEAARALIEWAFTNEILKTITACCAADNVSSVGLLQKLGFIETEQDNGMIYLSRNCDSRPASPARNAE